MAQHLRRPGPINRVEAVRRTRVTRRSAGASAATFVAVMLLLVLIAPAIGGPMLVAGGLTIVGVAWRAKRLAIGWRIVLTACGLALVGLTVLPIIDLFSGVAVLAHG